MAPCKCLFGLLLLMTVRLLAQSPATISEQERQIYTYAYDDPNPVPIQDKTSKIYPYNVFDGYSQTGKMQEWKVVTLENDYVKVYVLPQVGGKIWAAEEKSTGNDFLYHNEVLKFRDIAMRGPWTSGGVEFNFGIIGHTPSTASPVDYVLRKNDDGSVSCIVGNLDLPSRTNWRVEIRLPKDKAYVETRALWNNPTPVNQSYYNWMTGSAAVSNDLEFYYTGVAALEHSGEPTYWPIDDKGRDLSRYPNNNFGSHKSIHTVGEYNDFMGGYYDNKNFGFGHWALYDEMPGHKLWLWALSRNGGIWEDLLTDKDGQYMEFQAGRLFNQYSPSDNVKTSITQVPFSPGVTDRWTDIWFPVKKIGGISEVSPHGVLYVERTGNTVHVGVNSFRFEDGTVVVTANGKEVFEQALKFKPMGVFMDSVAIGTVDQFTVTVNGMDLQYNSAGKAILDRPFTASPRPDKLTEDALVPAGRAGKGI